MQSIRQVARLNELELQKCVPPGASWHTDYRDTAYIYIGGLPFELSEGDVLTIFSQYGNPVHINLVRDKETGKSKGFAFLKYEDQRSCDLAVDNLSGAQVMGRMISVDHTRYKKKEGEVETVGDEEDDEGHATDREGADRRKRRRTESESESEEERPLLKEEIELAKLKRDMDEDDPMKAYLVKEKQAEVEEALKAVGRRKARDKARERRHRHRHHRSHRDEYVEDRDERRNGHRSRHERDKSDEDAEGRNGHGLQRDRHRLGDEDARTQRRHRSRRDRSDTPDSEEYVSRRRRYRDDSDDEVDDDRRRRRDRLDRSHSGERHRRRK